MTTEVDRDLTLRAFLKPLDSFLSDPDITEIVINRPNQIYVEKNGHWQSTEKKDLTYSILRQMAVAAASYAGGNNSFGSSESILSAVLPGGERAQFVIAPACAAGKISITIRKPSYQIRTLKDYVSDGFFDHIRPADTVTPEDLELESLYRGIFQKEDPKALSEIRAEFLTKCVVYGKNIVIAGETGSGKTTFMKALMQSIPSDERIITIEDVPELVYGLPNHDNQVNLFYPSEAKADSTITASILMRSCLRMKPDRILLAELRGPETSDFLHVCLSGHKGSITSCHAKDCAGVFEYLGLKVQQSPDAKTLKYEEIQHLLKLTIDVVVHIHRDREIGRHITEIWYNPRNMRGDRS